MPLLTRWHVKVSFVYLALAFLLAIWIAAAPLWGVSGTVFSPLFFHFFLVGWVTQIIFGIAYWMLPKYSRESPRRSATMAWFVFWMLNVGLLLRAVSEPLVAFNPAPGFRWLLVLSALLQWLAGMGFVLNTWGRVKER